ncbi:hypothetical protein Tco_1348937, partial [Tanacetum coccineum]
EDASKQGRKIANLDADEEVTLIDETQERNDEEMLFDTLIEIKAAKPKAVTSAATTTTTIRPKAKGVVVQEPKEQEQLSIEEKSKLFVELLEKRKRHLAALRAQKKRSKPPTKAQKRNIMSTYLKNMAGYKHNQLKSKSYDEIQEMFNKEMKRVNTFVDMNTELVKSSETRTEGSSKRAGDELESDKSKKQKLDERVEAKKDDQEEDYDREDLEALWKLVKAKHENTRPEEDYERVLWGDLKVMFEPDIKSEVWRNLQGYKVTVGKLFNNCGMINIKFRGGLLGLKDFKMILRVTTAQLQLLSDYYCWKDYADREGIKID